ncbi:hypothetical protein CSUNSWCD_1568 [Campylobacter showae CSUNSWCD]|uniref:Uncharacterized protein n=1 Tax=Campylobacter showae CSUNSWCD TaxID=1244083 RepID=M5IKG8_9BACT|nr:hypothetical protein CSUNSWCD_1568 [Campylobacter showae CSUNSWCD]
MLNHYFNFLARNLNLNLGRFYEIWRLKFKIRQCLELNLR